MAAIILATHTPELELFEELHKNLSTTAVENLWAALHDAVHWPVFQSTISKAFVALPVLHLIPEANDQAAEYARTKVGDLITDLTKSQLDSVRQITMEAFTSGQTNKMIADRLEKIIGLTTRDAGAVQNYRHTLLKSGIQPWIAEDRATQYSERLRYQRAVTIASYEVSKAMHMGQLAAWQEATDDGNIPNSAKREWVLHPSEKNCMICKGLAGDRIDLTAKYDGGYSSPPAHPHCACTEQLVQPYKETVQQLIIKAELTPTSQPIAQSEEEWDAHQGAPWDPNKHYRGYHGRWAEGGPHEIEPAKKQPYKSSGWHTFEGRDGELYHVVQDDDGSWLVVNDDDDVLIHSMSQKKIMDFLSDEVKQKADVKMKAEAGEIGIVPGKAPVYDKKGALVSGSTKGYYVDKDGNQVSPGGSNKPSNVQPVARQDLPSHGPAEKPEVKPALVLKPKGGQAHKPRVKPVVKPNRKIKPHVVPARRRKTGTAVKPAVSRSTQPRVSKPVTTRVKRVGNAKKTLTLKRASLGGRGVIPKGYESLPDIPHIKRLDEKGNVVLNKQGNPVYIRDPKANQKELEANVALRSFFLTADDGTEYKVTIPPLWTDVKVVIDPASDPTGQFKVVAKGWDRLPVLDKNRNPTGEIGYAKQLPTLEWTRKQNRKKWIKMELITALLPKFDALMAKNSLTNDVAGALLLMRHLGLRPDSEGASTSEVTYGATTLLREHVHLSGKSHTELIFKVGKGKGASITVKNDNPDVFAMLKARMAQKGKPGDLLFQDVEYRGLHGSAATNAYMREIGKLDDYISGDVKGQYSQKDLRTRLSNQFCSDYIKTMGARAQQTASNFAEFKKFRMEIAKYAADKIGHQPAAALKSYINPIWFAPMWDHAWDGEKGAEAVNPEA